MSSYGVIYCIRNILNGKIYIGQTTKSPKKRWKQHVGDANRQNTKDYESPFHRAIRKYGEEYFVVETLHECSTQKELDYQETLLGESLDSLSPNGYNLRLGSGRGSVSEEFREKMSKALIGKKKSLESILKTAEGCSKIYSFISPQGEQVTITGLCKFCREHPDMLNASAMCQVAKGRKSAHKGWRKYSEIT